MPGSAWTTGAASFVASLVLCSCAKAPDAPPVRLSINPPEHVAFAGLEVAGPAAISPDGSRLAFIGVDDKGDSRLWVRSLDGSYSRPLAANATYPFWSPDSRYVAFFADGQLKSAPVSGGPPKTLCPALDGRGGSWGASGTIVFAPGSEVALSQVSANGGEPVPATTLGSGQTSHRLPEFLPDGQHFLYVATGNRPGDGGIFIGQTGALQNANTAHRLMSGDGRVSYAPPGYLLYTVGENLVARPFDSRRLAFTAEPLMVTQHVDHGVNSHAGDFSVSSTGVLAWRAPTTARRQLASFDRTGRRTDGLYEPYFNPNVSKDGRQVALSRLASLAPPTGNIWLLDPVTGSRSQFTFGTGAQLLPTWAPDSRRVVYGLLRPPDYGLYVKNARGETGENLLLKTAQLAVPMDWSRDGRFLLFAQFDPTTKWDLWVLPLAGKKPLPVVRTPSNEGDGQLSPDGRWLAFWSDKSGRYEVYVQPFRDGRETGLAETWRVSTGGGTWPRWRGDGKELFFKALDNRMMSVPVHSGPTFEAGAPVALFDTNDLEPDNLTYDVSSDGQRFLVSGVFESASRPVIIRLNWLAGLKR